VKEMENFQQNISLENPFPVIYLSITVDMSKRLDDTNPQDTKGAYISDLIWKMVSKIYICQDALDLSFYYLMCMMMIFFSYSLQQSILIYQKGRLWNGLD
jgi:hypothetical protein